MDWEWGYDDLLNIPTAGLYAGVKAARGGDSLDDDIGELAGDFAEAGTNRFEATPYNYQDTHFGGYEDAAREFSQVGLDGMYDAQGNADWFMGEAQRDRGPQAWENQQLSDNEAWSRGYDQAGALQLAREAAMGNAPSEAAFMMQRGLDSAVAGQQSAAGSARGAAALAQAQSNAAANTANLQNQAYTSAGQLRANEMAAARGQYGGLAGQMRQQDMERLQAGNQMAQYNAGLNDQYRMGMANAGNAAGTQSQGWYGQSMDPYKANMDARVKTEQMRGQSHSDAQATNAGVEQANSELKERNRNKAVETVIGVGKTFAGSGGGGMGGT
jgi:hypothetical protein